MRSKEARLYIEALANGIDPLTGTMLPNEGPLNDPQVIRALFFAVRALDATPEPSPVTPGTKPLANAGRPWTPAEEEECVDMYDSKIEISVIAERHGRTVGAITSRLVKLGRIERTD